MNAFLRIVLVAAVAGVLSSPADAQQWRGRHDRGQHDRGQAPKGQPQYYHYRGAPHGGMSSEQRERLRQEVTSARQGVYRDRDRGPPPEYDPRRPPQRPMAPAERDRLRRDIQNANRDFERRR
jgi:hypothetical protein